MLKVDAAIRQLRFPSDLPLFKADFGHQVFQPAREHKSLSMAWALGVPSGAQPFLCQHDDWFEQSRIENELGVVPLSRQRLLPAGHPLDQRNARLDQALGR